MRIVIVHSEAGAGHAWRRELALRLPDAELTIDPGTPDGGPAASDEARCAAAASTSASAPVPAGTSAGPADYAVGWAPPADFFARHPALRGFFVAGAGVDRLLGHPGLPPDLPLLRLEDAGMGPLMADYCLHELLRIAGRHDAYAALQVRRQWQELPAIDRRDLPVGVLGMGVLGTQVARHLARNGFTVRGFARTARPRDGIGHGDGSPAGEPIEVLHGAPAWPAFLAATRVLVLLAPLTADTENRIDADALARLQPGGWLINVARGGLVVDADLIGALDAGRLAGATLDVFREEPLPASHPFWHHPRLRITPHVSGPTLVAVSAAQVAANLAAMARGETPRGQVDRRRGY